MPIRRSAPTTKMSSTRIRWQPGRRPRRRISSGGNPRRRPTISRIRTTRDEPQRGVGRDVCYTRTPGRQTRFSCRCRITEIVEVYTAAIAAGRVRTDARQMLAAPPVDLGSRQLLLGADPATFRRRTGDVGHLRLDRNQQKQVERRFHLAADGGPQVRRAAVRLLDCRGQRDQPVLQPAAQVLGRNRVEANQILQQLPEQPVLVRRRGWSRR